MGSAGRRNSVSGGSDSSAESAFGSVMEQAAQAMSEGVFEKALIGYTEVVCEALAARALCLIKMEDYQEAIVNCEFALHFKSNHGKTLIRKAKALCKLQRSSEAKACRAMALPYLKTDDLEVYEVGTLLGLNDGSAPPKQANEESENSGNEEEVRSPPSAAIPLVGASSVAAGSPKISPKEANVVKAQIPVSPPHSPKETISAPDPATLPPPPVLPDSAGRGAGRGLFCCLFFFFFFFFLNPLAGRPSTSSGGRGTPLAQRRADQPPGETPLSPGAVKKALPQAPSAPAS